MKILCVDLNSGKSETITIHEQVIKDYLGGSGLAVRLFLDGYNYKQDCFASQMPIMFITGLLTGTGVLTGCKFSVCAKSPLTGVWGESTCGGSFGAYLKFTGYDGIIITGKSSKPSYIYIENGSVHICDAKHLWGLDTFETTEKICQETTDRAQVATIGPAGENHSRMASIMIGGVNSRAAGRGGMGALMASKNLKAVVVYGEKKPTIYNTEAFKEIMKREIPRIRKITKGLGELGTAGGMHGVEARGDLPIKNWRIGTWEQEKLNQVNNETLIRSMFKKHYSCYSCAIHCGKEFEIPDGEFAGTKTPAPEYETNAGFGSNCFNDNGSSIVKANELCNRYGLDTISTAMTISFAMEAYERGIITKRDTDGLEVSWGNYHAILDLIEKIAFRKGFGDVLADGSLRASRKLGKNSEEFLLCTKGLELPLHDPRSSHAIGVNYATGNRGACHLDALTYYVYSGLSFPELGFSDKDIESFDSLSTDDSAKLTVVLQNYLATFNGLGICKFILRGMPNPSQLAPWINSVTGWDYSGNDLVKIGERIFNAKRLFNVNLGISRKDDTLPLRILSHKRGTGHAADSLPNLGRMLNDYYWLRDWDEFGIPRMEKRKELGLI